jgi:hypothetical protein
MFKATGTLLAGLCLLAAGAAMGAEITGSVKAADGRPLMGALVTLTRGDGLFAESVYADSDGHFTLKTRQQGKARLRARSPYFADSTVDLELDTPAKPETAVRRDFRLAPLTDPQAISDSLSASAHFARIQFPTALEKQWFQVECLTCPCRVRRPDCD